MKQRNREKMQKQLCSYVSEQKFIVKFETFELRIFQPSEIDVSHRLFFYVIIQ
jgi:hypothetical protein